MNRPLAAALLVLGAVLLFFGVQAYNSMGSELTEAVTGAPTNKALWLIGLGVVSAVGGFVGLVRR
jgi:hypothetical protein